MTSVVAVCAILCRCAVQPPTATVCSGESSCRLRSPTMFFVPQLIVVAFASSVQCPSRRVENDSTNFACPCLDHKSQAPRLLDSDRQKSVLECFPSLLWFACEGTGVSTGARAQRALHSFCSADQEVQDVCTFFYSRKNKQESLDICSTDNRP